MEAKADDGNVRDRLFDAARELIGTLGYTEMSHADLTAEVGIGRTTFYEHFSSKEDLLERRATDPNLSREIRV